MKRRGGGSGASAAFLMRPLGAEYALRQLPQTSQTRRSRPLDDTSNLLSPAQFTGFVNPTEVPNAAAMMGGGFGARRPCGLGLGLALAVHARRWSRQQWKAGSKARGSCGGSDVAINRCFWRLDCVRIRPESSGW